MKKILYITTISGFLPQFEKNDVEIMQNMGYENVMRFYTK